MADDLFDSYAKAKNLRPSSQTVCRSRWNKFQKWIEQNGLDLKSIEKKDLIKFNESLSVKGKERYTALAGEVLGIHFDQDDLVEDRPAPKIIPLSYEQAVANLNRLLQDKPQSIFGFCALLALCYGLKLNEIENLSNKNMWYNSDNGVAILNPSLTKRRSRELPVSESHVSLFQWHLTGKSYLLEGIAQATFWRQLKKELSQYQLGSSLQALRNLYTLSLSDKSLLTVARTIGHILPLSTAELILRLKNEHSR